MPPKKKLSKSKPANDRLPTKQDKWKPCTHSDRNQCFQTIIVNGPQGERNVFHWLDEAGAIMSAMRTSRQGKVLVHVYDPEGHVIVQFKPRQYDWKAHLTRMGDNDRRQFGADIWKQINEAASERRLKEIRAEYGLKEGEVLTGSRPTKKTVAKKPLKKAASKPLRKKLKK